MTTIDFSQVARVCGRRTAEKLAEVMPGVIFTVPTEFTADLAQDVGPLLALRLVKRLGGVRIDVPIDIDEVRRTQDLEIKADWPRVANISLLMAEHELTEWEIRNIIATGDRRKS